MEVYNFEHVHNQDLKVSLVYVDAYNTMSQPLIVSYNKVW